MGKDIFKELYGFDLSKRIRKWNINNHILNLENLSDVKKFYVVMLFHVLEHIKKPLEFLNFIRKQFDNIETLIIEVPNNDELLISELSNIPYKNNHYSLEHLNYFNSDSLNELFNKSPFKVIFETQYQRYTLGNTFGWLKYGKLVIKIFLLNLMITTFIDYMKVN